MPPSQPYVPTSCVDRWLVVGRAVPDMICVWFFEYTQHEGEEAILLLALGIHDEVY